MKNDEIRRMAIRLAKHTNDQGDSFCGECHRLDLGGPKHNNPCPIAELEAEEAASKLRPVEPKRNPDNVAPDFISRADHIDTNHEARPYNPEKTAGEFEGEY